ncbi:MAG: CPBP family intramembrane metalloprotease [Limosilactobacillus gorillae]|uniref:CPBP family intramembrane glutamic endopeptidase n=1 Tax=Limosilactobacillus gorillae TaxID=1450649 RepID=UPI000AA110AA|nr:CPBP family intramembrane glutamic endopeptidase [Limosilactobacillus gorillae]MDO4855131.1 CPBP family intramembrane metalloprotease [Limosilactobacillus gorillae]
MSGRDYLHIWYETQLVATLFFVLVISGWEVYVGINQGYLMIFLGIIMVLGLIVSSLPAVPHWLELVNQGLQAIFQPLTLIMVWGIVTRQIIVRLHLPARGVVVLALLYYLIMFAPFASEIGGQFKWAATRIGYSFFWFLMIVDGITISLPVKFAGPPVIQTIAASDVVGALAFLITAITLMRAWKLAWPGLWPKFGWGWSWWTLAALIVIDLLFTVYNTVGGSIVKGLGHRLLDEGNILVAVSAAVSEEALFRFVILTVLLLALRNTRWQLGLAITSSALLFGLAHLLNLTTQPLAITLYQVVGVTGIGLFFAIVFLYTGQLWLVILMHFLLDWFSFSVSGTTVMNGTPDWTNWLAVLVELAMFALVTIWMLNGRRRVVIERHANRLIGEDQHFGYRLDFRF